MDARAELRFRRLRIPEFLVSWSETIRSFVGLSAVVFVWWGLSMVPSLATKLPAPDSVLRAWLQLLLEGVVFEGLWGSGRSFLAAWMIASVLGITLGLLMAASRTFRDMLTPIIELLRPIPSAAIIPLAIVFLGLNDPMKIGVATYAATWPVLVTAAGALSRIDEQMVHVCRQFGLRGRLRYLLRVQIPSVSPELLTSLRTSSIIALALTITTELVSSGNGLGTWIVRFEQAARVPEMYACIITVMLLGSLLYAIAIAAETMLTPWVARPT
jgi:ABC-type nitrate/sulfonate/bicarbonate transport system permease component